MNYEMSIEDNLNRVKLGSFVINWSGQYKGEKYGNVYRIDREYCLNHIKRSSCSPYFLKYVQYMESIRDQLEWAKEDKHAIKADNV